MNRPSGDKEKGTMCNRDLCRDAVASFCVAGLVSGTALAGPGLNVFGLEHTPLGNAQLIDSGGRLTVSNIGSSGKDGVSIDLGPSQGLISEVDFGPAGSLRPGMAYWIDAFTPIGAQAGQDQKTMCARIQEVNGGQAAMSLDVQFYDPTIIRVEAFLDGQPNGAFDIQQPFPDPLLVSNIGSSGLDGVKVRVSNIGSSGKDGVGLGNNFKIDVFFEIEVVDVSLARVDGDPPVQFTRLSISLLDLPPQTPVFPINRVEMRAANQDATFELFVHDEALLLFDAPNRPLGQAQMHAGGDHLVVSNIGSSGKDGVRQDPLPPGTQRLTHQLNFPDPLPNEYVIQDTSGVSLDGLPPGEPVVRTVEIPPGGIIPQLTVDYSTVGALTKTVKLFLDDQLVFQQSGIAGTLAQFPNLPLSYGYDGLDRLVSWSPPEPVTIPGGPTILADALCASPDLPGPESGGGADIVWVAQHGSGMSSMEISLTYPSTCPWDCGDGDGVVGIVDFLALLAQWGGPGACDFDGDGIVGINDFLALLGAWGPCP